MSVGSSDGLGVAAGDVSTASATGLQRATVVVSDLKGSTALAERLDPETLREVLGRYFDEMCIVLEAYGGRIEKVIGDAIVAVFGLDGPRGNSGAIAAVGAADEARAVLSTLNDQLERQWGVRLVNRTGVCTGTVLVGMAAGDRVITGEAMEIATRMEQAAPPLEVLLAGSTHEAVRERVIAIREPDLEFVGASGSIAAYRLQSVTVRNGEHEPAKAALGGAGATARRENRRTVTIEFAEREGRVRGTVAVPGGAQGCPCRGTSRSCGKSSSAWRHGRHAYIGDAVIAVFGLERRREDDALRAVRAAVEMRDALAGVNAWLELQGSPHLEQRIGVNTGNLVAGDGVDRQRLVTGEAVNVAARLEQTAAAGEVVIGEQTAALVAGGARLEPLEALELKGKADPVGLPRTRHRGNGRAARPRRADGRTRVGASYAPRLPGRRDQPALHPSRGGRRRRGRGEEPAGRRADDCGSARAADHPARALPVVR